MSRHHQCFVTYIFDRHDYVCPVGPRLWCCTHRSTFLILSWTAFQPIIWRLIFYDDLAGISCLAIMVTFSIQMGGLQACTVKSVDELIRISGFLEASYRSPSRWCARCEVQNQSTLICLPPWPMSPSTFRLLIELLDGTLPHSSEIYFPDSLFQLAHYFLIFSSYVVDIYLEYLCSRLFFPSQLVEVIFDFLSQ